MLFPGLYNAKKRSVEGKSKYVYTVEHIEEYTAEFQGLQNRIDECTSAMGVWHQIHTGMPESAKT